MGGRHRAKNDARFERKESSLEFDRVAFFSDAVFAIDGDASQRQTPLRAYLDPATDERATVDAIGWIKGLRHALVDGVPLRRRFCFRGDSLWWFAELYLHKQQVVLNRFRTLSALENLIEREQPRRMRLVSGGAIAQALAPQLAAARGIDYEGPPGFAGLPPLRLARLEARASALNAAALVSQKLR